MSTLPNDAQERAASEAGGEAGLTSSPANRPDPGQPGAHLTNGKFAPGNSGGAGRPKSRPIRDAIKKALQTDPELLPAIVDALTKAVKGQRQNRFGEVVNELEAAAFIRDTVEGRPTQAVELSGGEDEETGEQKSIPVVLIPAARNDL